MVLIAIVTILFWVVSFIAWYTEWGKTKSLDKFTMKDWLLNLDKVTRLEVISDTREYQNHLVRNCKVSLQDKERTLKIFITK